MKKYTDPIELVNSMRDIDYGLYDIKNNKWVSMTHSFKDFMGIVNSGNMVVCMPEEVERGRMGTCWECTLYAYDRLCWIPGIYDIKAFYMENSSRDGNIVSTHTGIIYKTKYKRSKGYKEVWHWFEHAWSIYRGINGPFLSEEECHSHIKQLLQDYTNDPKIVSSKYIPSWEIDSFLEQARYKKYVTADEFIDYCRQQKAI